MSVPGVKRLASGYTAPTFRVRSCIGAAPHLFLLDELFRGTNAVERSAAGQAVLRELVGDEGGPRPHVVIAATHDLELVDLLADGYAAFHFGDAVTSDCSAVARSAKVDGITFDHQLKPGRATTRNAIAAPAAAWRAGGAREPRARMCRRAGPAARRHDRQSLTSPFAFRVTLLRKRARG